MQLDLFNQPVTKITHSSFDGVNRLEFWLDGEPVWVRKYNTGEKPCSDAKCQNDQAVNPSAREQLKPIA